MPAERRAALRCDASAAMGGGHLLRCATLAQALLDRGWRCRFLVTETTRSFAGHLLPAGADVTVLPDRAGADAAAWAAVLGPRPHWLVVDHYGLDASFEHALGAHCGRVAVLDDAPARAHRCDLLLDQNLGRVAGDYAGRVPESCRVLAGVRFALLRPAFARWRRRRRPAREAGAPRVLVSAGLTDPAGLSLLALDALARATPAVRAEVMLGAGSPVLERVRRRVRRRPAAMRLHVEPADPAAIMAGCDLAVGAGGGSAWERCCVGLPALVVTLADNQRPVARALDAHGAARWLGDVATLRRHRLVRALRELLARPRLRRRMAARARRLCDGAGAARVALAMETLADA